MQTAHHLLPVADELDSIGERIDRLGADLVSHVPSGAIEQLQSADLAAQELKALASLVRAIAHGDAGSGLAAIGLDAMRDRLRCRGLAA